MTDNSLEEAALRELKEETGIEINSTSKAKIIGSTRIDDFRYRGPDKLMSALVLVEYYGNEKGVVNDDIEYVNWMDIDKVNIIDNHKNLWWIFKKYIA